MDKELAPKNAPELIKQERKMENIRGREGRMVKDNEEGQCLFPETSQFRG